MDNAKSLSDILEALEECLRDLDAMGATEAAAHLAFVIDFIRARVNLDVP